MSERPVPEAIMPSVFSCVGMIVVNWTFVENTLDHWAAIVYQDHNGDSVEKELPRQFSRKVSFLKKCFRRIPSLSSFSDEAIAYLDRASELSKIRHYMVHGTLSRFYQSDASFLFVKIDLSDDKRQHEYGELRILGTDLVKAGEDLLAMASAGQNLSLRLLTASE